MPLPWVRLDTNFWSNPKILAISTERDGHRAVFVWVAALAYAGGHGTDGFIAREVMPLIQAREIDAERLVKHGLWWAEPGGWLINGWTEFQESTEESEQRSRRARAAAAARWEKAKRNPRSNASSNARGSALSIAPSNADSNADSNAQPHAG